MGAYRATLFRLLGPCSACSSRAPYQVYLLENTNSLPSGSLNFAIVPHTGARDEQFDPPLTRAKRLIGRYLESDLLGVELQRHILVAHGNTDDFDSADHSSSSGAKFFQFAT
jgi:hypothetical protein